MFKIGSSRVGGSKKEQPKPENASGAELMRKRKRAMDNDKHRQGQTGTLEVPKKP